MAKLLLEHVSKIYPGSIEAVRDLTLEVGDGELVVLVGPSGSGKTTVLRVLAGLEQPTSGTLYIGDRLATSLPPRERNLALVFQKPALYPHLNVQRNLEFAARMRECR